MAKVNLLKNFDLSFKKSGTFEKKKVFLLPILSILALVFGVVMVVIPRTGEINKLREELQSQRRIQQIYSDKNTALKTLNIENYALDLSDLTAGLPDGQDLASLIKTTSRLVQEEGLRIDDLKLDLKSTPEHKTNFQVSVFGDLKALKRVLDKMPESRRLLIPEKVEYNLAVDNSYQIQLVMSAPYQPRPKEIGSLESPLSSITPQQQDLLNRVKNFRKLF